MVNSLPKIPKPTFARAILDTNKRQVPQCIAHRGYKAAFPENTVASFRGAIEAGAQAIETDVHLTKDDVVVLSHDGSMKRCFGQDLKLIERNWEDVKKFKSLQEPRDTMPRLTDLLDVLSEAGNDEIWCLLDIKIDNDADTVMRLIAETLATHHADHPTAKPWSSRIVLGIWVAKFLPLCLKYLPGYPIMNIGFTISFSRRFLDIENVGFNMLYPKLVLGSGPSFVRQAREQHQRQVIAWTVNTKDVMSWCISHELDGVITDDPKTFLQVRDAHNFERRPWLPLSISGLIRVIRIWIWVGAAAWLFRKRFGPPVTRAMLQQPMQS